jgi:hypothetical protein
MNLITVDCGMSRVIDPIRQLFQVDFAKALIYVILADYGQVLRIGYSSR